MARYYVAPIFVSILIASMMLLGFPSLAAGSYLEYQEYPYNVDYLPTTYKGAYARTIQKKDILWMADNIKIEKPIMSNGGDVIIIADTIEIDSTIDTRPYLAFSDVYWAQNGIGDYDNMGGDPFNWWAHVMEAYDDYYFWGEQYDAAKNKYVFVTPKAAPLLQRRDRIVSGATVIARPQLPSGRVERVGAQQIYGLNSEDAPAIQEMDKLRPGKILLIAHAFNFCADCLVPDTTDPVGAADPYDKDYRAILNAGGLKGGRGGAGATRIYCHQGGECGGDPSGLSGAPSRGGDASSIALLDVGRDDLSPIATKIIAVSNIRGGRPAHLRKFRTGTLNQVNSGGKRGAPAFQLEGPQVVGDEKELFGADGTIALRANIKFDDAIETAAELIAEHATVTYDAKAIAMGISSERSVNPLPRRQFKQFLMARLQRQQLDLLAAIPGEIVGAKKIHEPESPVPSGGLLGALACDESLLPALTDTELELVKKLCQFKNLGSDRLKRYLTRTGGVFRSVPSNIGQTVSHADVSYDLENMNINVLDVVQELESIDKRLYDQAVLEQRARLIGRISSLNDSIKALHDKLEKHPEFAEVAAGAMKVIGSAASLVAAIVADDYWAAGEAALNTYRSWADFQKLFAASPAVGLDEMRNGLFVAQLALKSFNAEMEATNLFLVAQQSKTLDKSLSAQVRLDDRGDSLKFYYDDMVRAVVQSYIQDPDGDGASLNTELRAVASLIRDYPRATIPLVLPSLDDPCVGRQPVDFPFKRSLFSRELALCIRISADARRDQILYATDEFPGLPLVVIGRGKGAFEIPVGRLGSDRGLSLSLAIEGN